jgi:hypothetical protein
MLLEKKKFQEEMLAQTYFSGNSLVKFNIDTTFLTVHVVDCNLRALQFTKKFFFIFALYTMWCSGLQLTICYISSTLNQLCIYRADSRPKLVAGSHEGYSGHVDGKLREAKMNHPKGLTVDDRGNIYVADTMNMAIRKISDAGRCYQFFVWEGV